MVNFPSVRAVVIAEVNGRMMAMQLAGPILSIGASWDGGTTLEVEGTVVRMQAWDGPLPDAGELGQTRELESGG